MGSEIRVRAVVVSRFALDGGAMHGIVPRPLWEREHSPDAVNRIALVARAVIVEDLRAGSRVLVEAGLGQRWSEKERRRYAVEPGPELPEALAAAGVDPETITHVVLTHLHWDHAAGALVAPGAEGPPRLALPRAVHIVSEASLAAARGPTAKDAGSFRADDVAALLASPRLRLHRPGEALAPGLEARFARGHTEGQLVPLVPARQDGPPLALPTDLVPTRSHLRPAWIMAYDNAPTVCVAEKQALFAELASRGGGVALYHDPLVEAAWTAPSGELVCGGLDGPRRGEGPAPP